jgi:hypothetical protein
MSRAKPPNACTARARSRRKLARLSSRYDINLKLGFPRILDLKMRLLFSAKRAS